MHINTDQNNYVDSSEGKRPLDAPAEITHGFPMVTTNTISKNYKEKNYGYLLHTK